MDKFLTKVKANWPLVVICIICLSLRIWKISFLNYFTYDESVPAFVARRLILWHHIPLIGGATPLGFHLGPYFYWLLTVIIYIGNLNPIAWGWAGALMSIPTVTIIFLAGKIFESKKVGITAAIFWTFSYLANIYDRHFWALYWGPLLSLATVLLLYQIHKGKAKLVLLLSPILAFGIHSDPSNLMLVFLTVIVWIVYKIPFKKTAAFATLIFFLSFLPIVVFDLRHNFANTKPVRQFLNTRKVDQSPNIQTIVSNILIFPRAASRLIYTFGDNEVSKQYSYCRNFIAEKYKVIPAAFVIFSSLFLIIFLATNIRKKKEPGWQITSTLVLLYFIGIATYGTAFQADVFEHYLTGLFPLFLLIFAKYVSKLPKKAWLLLLVVFIVFNLNKLIHAQNNTGLSYKKEAIRFTMQEVGNEPFSLDSVSTCWKYSGYRYLFAVFGREPQKSYVDPNFSYLYGTTQIAETHPDTVVSFIIHDFVTETPEFYKRYAVLKSHEVKSSIFGNIEVIIMDNRNRWF